MTKQKYISLIFIILCVFMFACGNNKDVPENEPPKDISKSIEYANQHMVKVENEHIESYIERHKWNMKKTGTGLRYMIYKEGSGLKAEAGNLVKIKFSVELINGTKCYNSEQDGPKEFLLNKSDEINGLHEGVMLMKVGDKAKLILPPHLAFGLLGDQEKIPLRATLIYDVELMEIITN
ncbi:MAG: FKBP-type peptidyl-prolyl cis-trans isomerase [Saprospiraceae bacterium]|nr:FKBP-type peptidyl-prolyl cis-trans isomerase [Saprospiraceae bacterium]